MSDGELSLIRSVRLVVNLGMFTVEKKVRLPAKVLQLTGSPITASGTTEKGNGDKVEVFFLVNLHALFVIPAKAGIHE